MSFGKMFREECSRQGLGKDLKALGTETTDLQKDFRGIVGAILDAKKKTPKEIATISAQAGAVNAALEGVLTAAQCRAYVQEGSMTGRQAVSFVVKDASSGFLTSTVGSAVSYGISRVLGTQGPISIAVGMAASAGTRYVYRQVIKSSDLKGWVEELRLQEQAMQDDDIEADRDDDDDSDDDDDDDDDKY